MSDDIPEKAIPLPQPNWPLEDDLLPLYANQFSVTKTPQEVVLVFGEFIPTGFPRRSKDEIDRYLESATIHPLSKIVVSHSGLEALFNLLKGQVEQPTQETKEEE